MEPQNHSVKQKIMDITFSERDKVHELSAGISALCRNRLEQVDEAVFDQVVPAGLVIKLDKLELDLGLLEYPYSEEEFTMRYRNALENALLGQLQLVQNNGGVNLDQAEALAATGNYALLLHYFLLHGSLPWWASGGIMTDPRKVFQALLEKDPELLKRTIAGLAHYSGVRYRLVYQFPVEAVKAVIALFEPAQAAFIFEYHASVVQLQRREQLVKSATNDFEKELWLFILNYLFAEHGSHFNRKMFTRSTLGQLAAKYNISYQSLLTLMGKALNRTSEHMQLGDTLPAIIAELTLEDFYTQSAAAEASEGDTVAAKARETETLYELLGYFLSNGSLPYPGGFHSPIEVVLAFRRLKQLIPAMTRQLLTSAGKQEAARWRIVKTFSEEAIREAVTLLDPANAGFIIGYVDNVSQVQVKKSVVKANASDFRLAVWQFTLGFLSTEHGSVFSARMFVESNIRQMARHYNMDYKALLLFMTQAIGEEQAASENKAPLFFLLHEILREAQVERIITAGLPGTKPVTGSALADAQKNTDTLIYWLAYGHLPWWAESGYDPVLAINSLHELQKEEALKVLKMAWSGPSFAARLIKAAEMQTLFGLLALLDNGFAAQRNVRAFGELTFGLRKTWKHEDVYALLFGAAFEIYSQRGFQSFSEPAFVRLYLLRLSTYMQKDLEKIRGLWLQSADAGTIKLPPALIKLLRSGRFSEEAEEAPATVQQAEPDSVQMLARHIGETALAGRRVLDEVLLAIEHYLQWGRLPEALKALWPLSEEIALRQLLKFAASRNLKALEEALINNRNLGAEARMRFHNLVVFEKGPEWENIRAMLALRFESDLGNYLNSFMALPVNGQDITVVFRSALSRLVAENRAEELRKVLSQRPLALLALQQLDKEQALQAIDVMASKRGSNLVSSFTEVLAAIFTDKLVLEKMIALLLEFSLGFFAVHSVWDLKLFTRGFVSYVDKKSPAKATQLREALTQARQLKQGGKAIKDQVLSQLLESNKLEDDEKELIESAGAAARKEAERAAGVKKQALREAIADALQKEEEKRKEKEPAPDHKEKLYIHNAGLVLLHPFLGMYFTRCGLMEKGKFNSEEAQCRAVHLLQYLAFETEKNAEHELSLNKLLCGLPLHYPVPEGIELSGMEKETSAGLIQAVLSQWEKLGSSSPSGFKASFLQRDGALHQEEDNWVLRVEQKAYDVLLNTMPWGLGLIKPLWMEKPLLIEWT